MCDKPQTSEQDGPDEDTRQLVRESHAMRSVVRNMVVNMETVLSDLHDIMGDIQSLVVQIDTVTDKIDQQCGPQGEGSNSLNTLEHCVRKPEFVQGTKMSTGAVHNALYSHTDSEKTSRTQTENVQQESDIASHNVLQVKAFRRDHSEEVSDQTQSEQSRSKIHEVSANIHAKRETRLPSSSKSFSHFSKEGTGMSSPSGGIAIVYPTIKCSSQFQAEVDDVETCDLRKTHIHPDKMAATKASEGSIYFQRSSPAKRNKLVNNPQYILSATSFQDNEMKGNMQTAAKHKYGITSVYNKSFQPVTPTEQRSPVIPIVHRCAQKQISKHDNLRVSNKDYKPYRVSYPAPEKSSIPNSPSHKYCTIGGSLSSSLQTQREPSLQYQRFIPSSPLIKRSATKAVYSTVHGSPVSSRSQSSIRRRGTENYYFSIESDLDSDALIENLDNRTVTPDIDWSYLNLVGNDNFRTDPAGILETPSSDHAYETPVTSARLPQSFQMLQTSPDVIARLPVINIQSMSTSERYIRCDTNVMFQGHYIIGNTYTSPVVAHLFCSEVISFKTSGYCDCYESVLDSVLENLAGFESFEDACNDLDNEEVMNETYVSFEDGFEEDDWDVGMRSDDRDEYDLSSLSMQALYHQYEQTFFERIHTLDDNRNIFAASDSDIPLEGRIFSTDAENSGCIMVSGTTEGYNNNVNQRINKRRLSPVFSDADTFDDFGLPVEEDRVFGDKDCCAITPSFSNKDQNFILLPKSFFPNDLRLFSGGTGRKVVTECDTEMSSSDDTSCQAIGSGSPMSFSSPEAALTSPDTDRFVTSSEGDDLLTSQEEAYFHLSETQENANMSTARANMLQLRREFFDSLYSVCDKRDKERSQDNDCATIPEENIRCDQGLSRMDNSRDNISEAGSYQEDITSYNRGINTWTAYAIVHLHADDISDCASDIFNDNNVSCSMTSSYLDADNIGTAPGNQGLSC